jgi:protein-disulfide isomerase
MPRSCAPMLHLCRRTLLLTCLVGPGLVGLGAPAPARSQTPDDLHHLRQDITAIKQAQEALRQELDALKPLLRARQPAAPPPPVQPLAAVLTLGEAPVKGSHDAPLTLIEFSDYQCPFCRRQVESTLPALEQAYIATGQVRYVFHDFPLEAIHAQAFKAAEAAHCAGEQQQYWAMHDRLFAHQQALAPDKLAEYAQALGLEAAAFTRCLDSGTAAARIRTAITAGQQLGITGTPTLVLGVSDGNQVKAITMLRGAQPFSVLKAEIDKALAATGARP